jgi:hypothetical protein
MKEPQEPRTRTLQEATQLTSRLGPRRDDRRADDRQGTGNAGGGRDDVAGIDIASAFGSLSQTLAAPLRQSRLKAGVAFARGSPEQGW